MDQNQLREILEALHSGATSVEGAMEQLARWPFEKFDQVCLDHHRTVRQGFPEVIFGAGKTAQQVASIFIRLAETSEKVLATHVTPDTSERILNDLPEAVYSPSAHCLMLDRAPDSPRVGNVTLVSAGTSDHRVIEEAALTADLMGAKVNRISDVGVAGIHRVLAVLDDLRKARVVVVAAGMEGALPSVVGGLVSVPVIGVPTSVGYGASFGGVAALLGMLNSCASGVSVVNIDNGFGAGYQAALINRLPAAD